MKGWIVIFLKAQTRLVQLCEWATRIAGSGQWHNPQRIMLFRSARLGDFMVSIPALDLVRRQFPGARITLLTIAGSSSSMQAATRSYASTDHFPWMSLIHPSLIDEVSYLEPSGFLAMVRSLRVVIAKEKPDAVFFLPYSGEGALGRLNKIALFRLAFYWGRILGIQVSSTIGVFENAQWHNGVYEHQVMGPLRAVAEHPKVNLPTRENVRFPLQIPLGDYELVDNRLCQLQDWKSNHLVAVFPGGTFSHKVWPIERYISVVEKLSRNSDYNFVIIGLKEDRLKAEMIAATAPGRCLITCGELQIPSLAALFTRCSLLLGNDSGPMHVAAAIGCPCITIMSGIERHVFWSPWGNESHVQRADIWCSPCRSATVCPRGNPECVTAISIDRVFEACRAVLTVPKEKRKLNN